VGETDFILSAGQYGYGLVLAKSGTAMMATKLAASNMSFVQPASAGMESYAAWVPNGGGAECRLAVRRT
jgi:hypothetical protein